MEKQGEGPAAWRAAEGKGGAAGMEVGGKEEKYGVPVGAIRIARSHIEALRDTLEKHLWEKIGFRGVDKLEGEEEGADVLVHLTPPAAGSVLDPPISSFLKSVNATFLPGVRKQHVSKVNRKHPAKSRKEVPFKAKRCDTHSPA